MQTGQRNLYMHKGAMILLISEHTPCRKCGSHMIEIERDFEKNIDYYCIACRGCGDRIIIEDKELYEVLK